MEHILRVEELSFNYGEMEILSGLDFSLAKGDYVALVGPNGAGKTTLVRLMLGLEKPTQGRIMIKGEPLTDFSDWRAIGYLPQKLNSFNPLFPATVREIVRLGRLSGQKFPRYFSRADNQAVDEALRLMEISDIQDKLITKLSGGQEQRVFLARALVADPEILILDEPGTALDPQARKNFFQLIKKLNQERGITVILITHDIGQSGQEANKLLYLDKQIVFFGSFNDFCHSKQMSGYFGEFSQHLICHQHE